MSNRIPTRIVPLDCDCCGSPVQTMSSCLFCEAILCVECKMAHDCDGGTSRPRGLKAARKSSRRRKKPRKKPRKPLRKT